MLAVAVAARPLSRLRLPLLARLLEPRRPPLGVNNARVDRVVRLIDPVIQFGRPLVRPGCLTRGITLYYFLRRAGLDVTLDFGMGRMGDEFGGHCWITKDGEPYLETLDPRLVFAHMYRMPRRQPGTSTT